MSDREKIAGAYDDVSLPFLTWRSLALGAFASLGGIVFGYDTGQISGFQAMNNYLYLFGRRHADGHYAFSNVRSGLIVGLLSIGTLIGALLAAPLADRVGRKLSISFWCVILCVGTIVQISSSKGKWYQVMIGRLITGVGVGACSLLVPMYQGECSPRHIRGAMICSYQLFVTLGIFVAYCINYGTEGIQNTASWRIPLGITFLWPSLLGVGILFFPESPRYDFRHGRAEKAKRTMSKLHGVHENHRIIVREIEEVKAHHDAELSTKDELWYEMFRAPRMAYRIVLGMALQALQQLTGANYFFYYGTTTFRGAGISNSFVTQMILGAVNFGTTFGGLYIVEHFGRRKSLITGGIVMFVCFIVYASVGHFALNVKDPPATPGAGKTMVVFACLFITAFAMTWGPMIWTIVAELYPSRYRARAMALATASNWLWNFLISFFTPFIAGDIDFAYGYVFAGCLFVGIIVVYVCVLETKNKTLEEIDVMYVLRVTPWRSSKWVPPPSFGDDDRVRDKLVTTEQIQKHHRAASHKERVKRGGRVGGGGGRDETESAHIENLNSLYRIPSFSFSSFSFPNFVPAER